MNTLNVFNRPFRDPLRNMRYGYLLSQGDLFKYGAALWSFQKRVLEYAGNCIQLSDGTTHQDIGFLPQDDDGKYWVDGYAMFDAIASGKTHVRTWYDQYGNADLTQRSFSISVNPIVIDQYGTPAGTPAVIFGIPSAGQNALHDNVNGGILSDIFTGGGAILCSAYFSAAASSASYLWPKGSANYWKYHNSSTLRFAQDRATTDALFHKSSFPATANNWWTAMMDYNSDLTTYRPNWKVDNGAYGVGSVTTTPVGAVSSDAANKFSLGNRATGASGCMAGGISEFGLWDRLV